MLSDKIIAFDLTQKEWGRVNENYSIFKNIFEEIGFQSEIYIEFPLKLESLKKCSIFVILCPDSSKLRSEEINNLIEFVAEGGILMIFSSAGGDQGRRTNLNELLKHFGLGINNNEVMDQNSNLGINSYVLINMEGNLTPFNSINKFCFRCGCSLTTINSQDQVLFSNKTSTPPECPLFIISKYRKGLILLSGSYETFRDDLKGGITFEENKSFTYNLANYLWEYVNNNGEIIVSKKNSNDLKSSIKISLFKKNELIEKGLKLSDGQLNNRITNLEQEFAELYKDNDLFKIECKRIYKNMEEQLNEFQIHNIEGFKDDIEINIDEILTNFDLKVNNLTSKMLKIEKNIEDFNSEIKNTSKRMSDIEDLFGQLIFKYENLATSVKKGVEIKKDDENFLAAQKNKDFEDVKNLLPSVNEEDSKPHKTTEEKLHLLFKLRDDLIKKYKSGELSKKNFEDSLKRIENKINHYRNILIEM
ncbi:MAG: hypothetical protein EAX96_01580 [Candidatus Lokiarchaeota archaeon]|nr:hypothetical protein [Candidatus Lokiarchaeota archaeon]